MPTTRGAPWTRGSGSAGPIVFFLFGQQPVVRSHLAQGVAQELVGGLVPRLAQRLGAEKGGVAYGEQDAAGDLPQMRGQTVDIDGLESGALSCLVDFEQGRAAAVWPARSFNLLLVLTGLYVMTILAYLLLGRKNLIGPMVSGRAAGDDRPAAADLSDGCFGA
jgi:hypothetical protein